MGRVEDDEHVGGRASVGLEQLAIVGERARGRRQKEQQHRDTSALAPDERREALRSETRARGAQNGNLPG
jgi:acetyl-CoA carboxylase alpha subunit